jgi:hypothetical protein
VFVCTPGGEIQFTAADIQARIKTLREAAANPSDAIINLIAAERGELPTMKDEEDEAHA